MTVAPKLQVDHMTMQFGGLLAVDDLSLTVGQGEIVALIGPNGAGKTTAFNVITSVYAPSYGRILLDGLPIAENTPRGKMKKLYRGAAPDLGLGRIESTPDRITAKGVARTFQNIRLFKDLTVFENVLIARHMHIESGLLRSTLRLNAKEESKMREDSLGLLDMLDLADYRNEQANNLPYGKQRRLEIARALATNPSLLLLDEPAAGMNPTESHELSAFIRKIQADFDLTIFMIEHHMNLVMDISDRIYVLDFGKLIAEGKPEEVQENPDVITAYLGVDE